MKLIESKVEIIEQEPGLEGVYKNIEKAGRLCYKSEDKICEGSAEKMVNFLVGKLHGTPLEHGTIYLHRCFPIDAEETIAFKQRYTLNKYSQIKCELIKEEIHIYVTTNYRVLIENKWLDDLQYLCEPTTYHEKRVSAKFILSRSIANEFIRHRVMSPCQESQRYCNYNLGKFGSEITFVIPEWVKDRINDTASYNNNDDLARVPYAEAVFDPRMTSNKAISIWLKDLKNTESDYLDLINEGLKPEDARSVLNNDCKTELMLTGFTSDWEHFLSLRTAKAAHPDARILANNLKWLLESNSLINCTNGN